MIHYISDSKIKLEDKVVLLRADLNSNVKNKKVLPSERIKESAETIKFLKKKKARVVIIAHQGRPGREDFVSLKQHAKLLNKFVKIKFISDIIGKKAEKEIKNLNSGEALLLDNVRKLKEEFKPGNKKNNKLVRNLSNWCDVYVNDAFSVCHRKQASVVSFPRYLKSYGGLLFEKEVKALKKINIKNCFYVLGGAKPEDNVKLLGGKRRVLACGLFGQMCVIAKGKNLGAQNKFLKKNIKNYDACLKDLKKKLNKHVAVPIDFAVKVNGKRKEIPIEDFPSKYEIFDIGKKTQSLYADEIKKAKSVYMKGPAGAYADKGFFEGTRKILKAISKNKGFSLLGGGHLADAVNKSKIPKKKFGHISLSGGALLDYIAGEKLPGLEVLRKNKK